MKKKPEFPDEIVLGVGYPWQFHKSGHAEIKLSKSSIGDKLEKLRFIDAPFNTDIKYRLILRRVK